MSRENVELVRRTFDAFAAALERGDPGSIFESATVAADLEWFVFPGLPGHPPSYRGRDGFMAFMRTWTEDFEDFSVKYERLLEAPENRVVALALQGATGKGSGAPVELHFGIVFEIEGGRVIRMRHFPTGEEALEAAGLSGDQR
jgi:ketosteroid isomerase-like protein